MCACLVVVAACLACIYLDLPRVRLEVLKQVLRHLGHQLAVLHLLARLDGVVRVLWVIIGHHYGSSWVITGLAIKGH